MIDLYLGAKIQDVKCNEVAKVYEGNCNFSNLR